MTGEQLNIELFLILTALLGVLNGLGVLGDDHRLPRINHAAFVLVSDSFLTPAVVGNPN